MTTLYPAYDRQALDRAVHSKSTFTFSLGTSDVKDLGITDPDGMLEIKAGGRFDLTTWRKWQPKPHAPQAMHTLHDASQIAGHLYLGIEPTSSADGREGITDITATYSPLTTTTPRTLHLDPSV